MIEEDDIVFPDFGPVFDEWEADLGRTYVMGDDPRKLRLRDDVAGPSRSAGSTSRTTPTSPAPSCSRS